MKSGSSDENLSWHCEPDRCEGKWVYVGWNFRESLRFYVSFEGMGDLSCCSGNTVSIVEMRYYESVLGITLNWRNGKSGI